MSSTNSVRSSPMVEFSGSHHKVPHPILSSFLDLSEIDTLCHINKYFKICFTESGNVLACRLHKLALTVLLSIQKIDSLTRRSRHNQQNCWVDWCHSNALKEFSEKNKVHVSPLRLYKYLIKSTKYEPFYEHFSQLLITESFSLKTSKTDIYWDNQTFFSLYSQLKQAKVYMPISCALFIRLAKENPYSVIPNKRDYAKICKESVRAWAHDSSKEELLEFSIGLAEQIFDPEMRGGYQSWIAQLCVEKGKIEIAQNLLGNIKGCDKYWNFIEAVGSLIKYALPLELSQRNRIIANVVSYSETVLGYLERQLKDKTIYPAPHAKHVKEGNDLSENLIYVINDLLKSNYAREAAFFAIFDFGKKEERDERIDQCSRALAKNHDWLEAFKLAAKLSDDTKLKHCWEIFLLDFIKSPEANKESLGKEIVNLIIEERSKETRSRILNKISWALIKLLKILPVSFCLKLRRSAKCKNLGDEELNSWLRGLKTEKQRKKPVKNTSSFTPLTSEPPKTSLLSTSPIPTSSTGVETLPITIRKEPTLPILGVEPPAAPFPVVVEPPKPSLLSPSPIPASSTMVETPPITPKKEKPQETPITIHIRQEPITPILVAETPAAPSPAVVEPPKTASTSANLAIDKTLSSTPLVNAPPASANSTVEKTPLLVETSPSLPADNPQANPTPTSTGDQPSGGVLYYLRAFCAAIVQGIMDFFSWIGRLCSRS